METRPPLLTLLGEHVRPLAGSALRLGWTVIGADTAATESLKMLVPQALTCPIGQYPQAFEHILRNSPEGTPWVYTPSLHRYPIKIGEWSQIRPLLGNSVNSLIAAQAMFNLDRVLRDEGFCSPELRHPDAELPDYCQWVAHDTLSHRGLGFGFAGQVDPALKIRYYRQHLSGVAYSATYIAEEKDCRFLGATRLYVGEATVHAPAFRYCGEYGPITLPEGRRSELQQIGELLAKRCQFRGLFTADFIDHDEHYWLVQLHPCYTDSVEMLELTQGISALLPHAHAFGHDLSACSVQEQVHRFFAKAIVFARYRLVMTAAMHATLCQLTNFQIMLEAPWIADWPRIGEVIEAGWPMVTVYGDGDSYAESVSVLQKRIRQMDALFHTHPDRPAPLRSWYERLDDPESD